MLTINRVAQDLADVISMPSAEELADIVRDVAAEACWTITLEGALAAATVAVEDYLADPSTAAGARMERRYDLAWKIAERGGR